MFLDIVVDGCPKPKMCVEMKKKVRVSCFKWTNLNNTHKYENIYNRAKLNSSALQLQADITHHHT